MARIRLLVAGAVSGAVLAFALWGGNGRAARRRRHRLVGHGHHLRGIARGVWYRCCRRHPDVHVDDLVLADRIRSTLGPVEHALDQPRVHVSVYRHVASLHGDVANHYAAERLVGAVRSVPGVVDVSSHLHVGLLAGDGCPSDALGR
ncbi:BON domain-containing protein [Ilumatobacter sp.]|uniref:BON domain-containing protein n=1 Tax=Ilumatobacter sp. TaxID=1967498 RepID=UPI003AF9E3FB